MAMSGALLGQQIKTVIMGLSDAEKQNVEIIWTKIGEAIVSHIQTNAVVATTGTAAAQTGTVT